ncbi:hypothetical protein GCM10009534_68480 [Kribbella sandramycini]
MPFTVGVPDDETLRLPVLEDADEVGKAILTSMADHDTVADITGPEA